MLNTKGRIKYENVARSERLVSSFVPFTAHVSPTALSARSGDLMRTWRCEGFAHETAGFDDILYRKGELNTLFQSIGADGADVALWIHTIPRRVGDRPTGTFNNRFCHQYDERYRATFDGYRRVRPEHYITLIYRPAPSVAGRLLSRVGRRTLEQRIASQKKAIAKLDDLGGKLEAGLERYFPTALSTYKADVLDEREQVVDQVECSELLSFTEFLISGEWQDVALPTGPINEALSQSSLFAGVEMIEIRTPTRTRYAQGLDLKSYPPNTEPGMLNGLFYAGYDFVLTQSFTFVGDVEAGERLGRQQTLLENSGNGSPTEEQQIRDALDDLAQGMFSMGDYHFSLMVFGDTPAEVEHAKNTTTKLLQRRKFIPAPATLSLDAMWYAQLPGNFEYRPRLAFLTTRNLACLAAMHGFVLGKATGNPWGPAVTQFKTPAECILNYNFHIESAKDMFGEKVMGNLCITGAVGMGKTVMVGHLLAQAQQFDESHRGGPSLTTVVFDLNRGARIAVAAMGGKYFSIATGEPTGFNPFQLEGTPENRDFLNRLIKMLVTRNGEKWTVADENGVSEGIDAVYLLPKKMRRISSLARSIPERGDRENSLVRRLRRWASASGDREAGPFAWALDNPVDEIDLSTHHLYGIDGTAFLNNPEVRGPISFYLLHRIKSAMGKGRFIYCMDEAWRWLQDDEFGDFAGEEQVTIRKKDGLGIFATQMPSQLLGNRHSAALVQQCATEIYLPNARATREDYIDGFKLSEMEYETVKGLQEGGRYFLIRQKFASGDRLGVTGCLDLEGMDEELSVLSGTSENNEVLDEILAEVGEDPDVWLPIFHQRIAARKSGDAPSRGLQDDQTAAPIPVGAPADVLELPRPGADSRDGRSELRPESGGVSRERESMA